MIDKFFIQTNDTIWDFLSEIGKSKEVFSCYSYYEIEGFILFFYTMPKEIVLVCLDIVDEGTVEYADEGVLWSEPYYKLFYKVLPNGKFSSEKSRISPVMELYNYAREMRKFFELSCQFDLIPAIHLVFLTNSHIVNYPEVLRTWQQNLFGFSALQNLSGLRPGIIYDSYCDGHPFIPVNPDGSIEGADYWNKWHKYLENRGWYDWTNDLYDDCPLPSDKRYRWKGEMGHLISDEFK
ncbi:MAG: hypothetical protein J5658_09365 [Prevotella sp.]|nr:hypothetical protein [Prevotella sp.]